MMRLEDFPGGFKLVFKDRVVLQHALNHPCGSIGTGTARYKMKYGHFKIKEKVIERRELEAFEISDATNELITISFPNLLRVTFRVVENRLEIQFASLNERFNRLWFALPATAREHIYGCGEQYSELDLRGKRVPIWCQEQGIGRGRDLISFLTSLVGVRGSWHTTYFPQPTFVSSSNYFCHAETFARCEFDFTRPDTHELYFWEIPAKLVIDVRSTAVEVVGSLSNFLGRQRPLPDWVFNGVWLGVQGGTPVVETKLQQALDAGVQVGALWCQDWQGIRMIRFGQALMWNWKYDDQRYPDLPATIAGLKARGIRFLGYINPMFNPEGDQYHEAAQKDFLVKKQSGEVYGFKATMFEVGMLDLSNPDARAWVKDIIKENMLGIGLAGWMCDYAEQLPVDGVIHSREDGPTFHNRYPVLWAQVNREAVQEASKDDEVVFFTRSGFSGTSNYTPCVWAGDQLVNWGKGDGLPTVIPAGVSLGFSGIGFFHSDIGGYTTVFWIKRDAELFMRWTEQATFTCLMRTHEGNNPPANVQYWDDPAVLSHFARFSKVFVQLKPYLQHLVKEYAESGLPVMRHPFLHYEDDEILHELKYQYLFGRDVLVAPVVEKGKTDWRVYLPADEWVHAWSGDSYRGGWHEVSAPLGEPPVFFRANSSFRALFEALKEIK